MIDNEKVYKSLICTGNQHRTTCEWWGGNLVTRGSDTLVFYAGTKRYHLSLPIF